LISDIMTLTTCAGMKHFGLASAIDVDQTYIAYIYLSPIIPSEL